MTLRLALLPAPPNGARHWSICTLAAYLCVPPAAVDKQLAEHPEDGVDNSPDIHSLRPHHSFRSADGDRLGDYHLTDDAADRIAAAIPTGLLARRIADGHPAGTNLLGPDQVEDLGGDR